MLSQPASTTNLASAAGSAASINPGLTGKPVHRPVRVRAERDVGEQPLVDKGTGPQATVGRVKHDRGGVEPDDHPSCPKRHGLQLHTRPDRSARYPRSRQWGR